jgi:hypothetical protein
MNNWITYISTKSDAVPVGSLQPRVVSPSITDSVRCEFSIEVDRYSCEMMEKIQNWVSTV